MKSRRKSPSWKKWGGVRRRWEEGSARLRSASWLLTSPSAICRSHRKWSHLPPRQCAPPISGTGSQVPTEQRMNQVQKEDHLPQDRGGPSLDQLHLGVGALHLDRWSCWGRGKSVNVQRTDPSRVKCFKDLLKDEIVASHLQTRKWKWSVERSEKPRRHHQTHHAAKD